MPVLLVFAGICYRWMANSALNVNSLLSKLFKAAGFEVDVRTKARSQNGDWLKLTSFASHQYSNEIGISDMILLIHFDRNERHMFGRSLRHNLIEMWRRFKAINKLLVPSGRPKMGDVWLAVWAEVQSLKSVVAKRISLRRRLYISA